jgi:hypothetical protein
MHYTLLPRERDRVEPHPDGTHTLSRPLCIQTTLFNFFGTRDVNAVTCLYCQKLLNVKKPTAL